VAYESEDLAKIVRVHRMRGPPGRRLRPGPPWAAGPGPRRARRQRKSPATAY